VGPTGHVKEISEQGLDESRDELISVLFMLAREKSRSYFLVITGICNWSFTEIKCTCFFL